MDRGGEPVGGEMGGEAKQGHGAGRARQVAAAVAEDLLHGGAILQAKLARVGVKKDRIQAAKVADRFRIGAS